MTGRGSARSAAAEDEADCAIARQRLTEPFVTGEELKTRLDELTEKPGSEVLAERANGTLMARWAPETRARLVMEFIAEHKLFSDLNKFLKGRLR